MTTYKIGIFLMIIGVIGGFSMLEDITKWSFINEISKDQIVSGFGLTWAVLGKDT